jgi:hypothetical protein
MVRTNQYTWARLVLIGLALVAIVVAVALRCGWLAGDPSRMGTVSLLLDALVGAALITLACVVIDAFRR